ncbi:MAG: hypothetical protein AAGH19_03510, partial [Pseudomonadota bacterium]
MRWVLQQFRDMLAYWVMPFLAFIVPASVAKGLAQWLSSQSWLYSVHTKQALEHARSAGFVDDPIRWQQTFRLVRFLDAVDTWHGHFSSDRRIKRSLVSGPEHWPEVKTLVLLGTHLGPSTLLLRMLAQGGYRPCLVFRGLQSGMSRQSPVFYAYL